MASDSLVFRTFEEVPEFVRICLKEGVPIETIHQTLKEAGLNTGFIQKAIQRAHEDAQLDDQLELSKPETTSVGQVSVISVKVAAHTKSMSIPPQNTPRHEVRDFTRDIRRETKVELDLAPLKSARRDDSDKDIYDPLLQRTVRFEKRASELAEDPAIPGNILPRKLTVMRTMVPEKSTRFLGMSFRGLSRKLLICAQTGILLFAAYLAYTFTFDRAATERFTILEPPPVNLPRK